MTNENLNSIENDILGFDPSQLTVYQEQPQQTSGGNPNIYHPKPASAYSHPLRNDTVFMP